MVSRQRAFDSFTNRLILHQSVIDTIAGVVFFLHKVIRPVEMTVSLQGNIYDQLVCRFIASDYLLWSVNVVSTYNLVIISLERLIATCYPVKYRNTWSIGMLKYAVGASWGLGLAYGTHMIIIYTADNGHCHVVDMQLGIQVLVGAIVVGIEFFIPLVILVVSYTKILIMLSKKLVNGRQQKLTKAKKNVLMTVLLSSIMFVICWTPTEYDYMKELFFPELWNKTVYIALTGLLACNMFVNPIIYCFNYKHFRRQLSILVGTGYRTNRVEDQPVRSVSRDVLQQSSQAPHVGLNVN
ncbi:trace amine-associated receptor 5-like [Asterias rubens]|uniref:trace amine-associated receptor 5-like n=1 Tax=Asterias rubens TaxID=7604 RepID=UPI001454F1AB|nr:trace amine-associated receptor 5-like [Asterias rubens]